MTLPPVGQPPPGIAAPAAGRVTDFVRPMIAASAAEPFDSPDSIFELMWGGVRAIARIHDGHARLTGRNGSDLTPFFPELAVLPDLVKARDLILDGEIVAIDPEGFPSFDLLRPRLHAAALARALPEDLLDERRKRVAGQITYQAFDLLRLDDRSLLEMPLWQRKNRLHALIDARPEFAAVDFVDDEGVAFFEAVLERRLEGIVAKGKMSTYTPGRRSRSWLEVRALQSGDFVVGGYTFGGARRKGEPFSQLLLGAYDGDRFDYVGAVSGGLNDAEARQLVALLEPLLVDEPPFIDPPQIPRLISWTRPSLVCHVRFSEWSRDGFLRFPIFSALRPDLDPTDCILP